VALGLYVRSQFQEANRATAAAALVQQLLKADIAQVPEVVRNIRPYRKWTDNELTRIVNTGSATPRTKLHASLALLPVDVSQVSYLESRLLGATPTEFTVLRDALKAHQGELAPKLWTALEGAKADEARLLPSAAALAVYDPDSPHWGVHCEKVAEALVAANP